MYQLENKDNLENEEWRKPKKWRQPLTQLDNEDTDDENELKTKIVKITGENLLSFDHKSHLIYYRKEDCPKHLSSFCSDLLEL